MKSLKSLIFAAVVTAIGLGVVWLAGGDDTRFEGMSLMLMCGLLAFAVNWLAFIPAALAQTEKYYDITGSLTYLVTIFAACAFSSPLDIRATIVAALVVIWTLRLGIFLFKRISADGHDGRFDQIKINPPRFLVAWTLQGAWVTLTAAAAFLIITSSEQAPLGIAFFVGLAMWVTGFTLETIADNQKRAFKTDPANKGKFIQAKLWAWVRHPNYFGEMLLWTGIFVMALPLINGAEWVVIISPVFVFLLLTKISGIPLLEKSGKERWGDNPEYQAYLERTPRLFRMPMFSKS